MDEFDILSQLNERGAVYTDQHFVYTSGKHGSGYINMDPIFTELNLVKDIGYQLSVPFWQDGFDTVAAPATGGIVLAFATALGSPRSESVFPSIVWADKSGDDFVFERAGFADQLKDKRVLVVEDLLTTGGSVIKTVRAARSHGANVVGVSAVCNRGGLTADDLNVPQLESLVSVSFETMPAGDCELCRKEVPIVADIGHGDEYQEKFPDYTGGYIKLLSA